MTNPIEYALHENTARMLEAQADAERWAERNRLLEARARYAQEVLDGRHDSVLGFDSISEPRAKRFRRLHNQQWRTEIFGYVNSVEPLRGLNGVVTVRPSKENEAMSEDMVNKAPHYNVGKYEVIEVLEDWKITDPYEWQVIKYVARARYKNAYLQDLQKARYYLDRRIKQLEANAAEQMRVESTSARKQVGIL